VISENASDLRDQQGLHARNGLIVLMNVFMSIVAFFTLPFIRIGPDKVVQVLLAFSIAVIATLVLTPLTMRLAVAAGVMDIPHARRVHTHPTPRWGGLAMYASFVLTIVLLHFYRLHYGIAPLLNHQVTGILVGGALMTALGALDDKFNLPAKVKLVGQIFAALVLTLPFFGVRLMVFNTALFGHSGHHSAEIFSIIFTVIWVVGITNTINLIDGLDGLAAGISGMAALTFLSIGVLLRGTLGFDLLVAALAGVCLGFLRYNFYPARVFMGDAGSHFLGFTIAALAVLQNWKVAAGLAFAVPALILAVPILDTAFAIIRRFRRGQPIFSPDKGHLHHRLLNLGLNQRMVVLCIYLLTSVACFLALLLARTRLWR